MADPLDTVDCVSCDDSDLRQTSRNFQLREDDEKGDTFITRRTRCRNCGEEGTHTITEVGTSTSSTLVYLSESDSQAS